MKARRKKRRSPWEALVYVLISFILLIILAAFLKK